MGRIEWRETEERGRGGENRLEGNGGEGRGGENRLEEKGGEGKGWGE